MKIAIISSSIRDGRNSHRVSKYIESYLSKKENITVTMIDLKERDFPLFNERISYLKDVPAKLKKYSDDIKQSDAVIVVSPEYNGSVPASLKNAVDVLYQEWQKKPIGLCSVSSGSFGGTQCLAHMGYLFWRIGATVANATLPVPNVDKNFHEDGSVETKDITDKNIDNILKDFKILLNIK